MASLSRQDELFLRMCKVSWVAQPKPAAAKPTVTREAYEEAMRFAVFYEEESHKKTLQIERLQQQRNWCFLGMLAGLVGLTAAWSIITTIKIAF